MAYYFRTILVKFVEVFVNISSENRFSDPSSAIENAETLKNEKLENKVFI
ncbi:hypothetical protein [Aequorivita flava]|uniref:Uncharacterized protein n=1 Tax=Aequorivita flava TaxID=3114371 RepID=A0AB35YXH7_9FLAO